jgi:hypothetical protein
MLSSQVNKSLQNVKGVLDFNKAKVNQDSLNQRLVNLNESDRKFVRQSMAHIYNTEQVINDIQKGFEGNIFKLVKIALNIDTNDYSNEAFNQICKTLKLRLKKVYLNPNIQYQYEVEKIDFQYIKQFVNKLRDKVQMDNFEKELRAVMINPQDEIRIIEYLNYCEFSDKEDIDLIIDGYKADMKRIEHAASFILDDFTNSSEYQECCPDYKKMKEDMFRINFYDIDSNNGCNGLQKKIDSKIWSKLDAIIYEMQIDNPFICVNDLIGDYRKHTGNDYLFKCWIDNVWMELGKWCY